MSCCTGFSSVSGTAIFAILSYRHSHLISIFSSRLESMAVYRVLISFAFDVAVVALLLLTQASKRASLLAQTRIFKGFRSHGECTWFVQ